MIVAIDRTSYIRPHKHLGKCEASMFADFVPEESEHEKVAAYRADLNSRVSALQGNA